MTTLEPQTIDGYIRVSRRMGRDGPGYISPDVQRSAIVRWAEYKGVTVAEWHLDEDQSGGTQERPGLERAVARCLAGETGGIVSWKIDRFSRNTEGGLRDLKRLQAAGARLAFVTEDIDTSGGMGKFVYTIMLAMAELALETIKASWIVSKGRALDRGARIGPTPFGYQRCDDGTLEAHPERADYVVEAFRRAREGVDPVVRYLDGLALVHEGGKRAGRPLVWNGFTVRRLLANRTYLGEQSYGDDVRPDSHPPLVTRGAWAAAQHEPAERRRAPESFPLSGIASCATCGGPMVGGRAGKALRTYRCAGSLSQARRRGTGCPAPATMVADRLEPYVDDFLRSWASTYGALVVGEPRDVAEVEATLAEAEEADAELAAFLEYTSARLPGYADGLRQREEVAQAQWAAYREAVEGAGSHERFVSGYQRMDEMTPDEWTAFLREIVDRVEVTRGRGPVDGRVRVFVRNPEPEERSESVGASVGEWPEMTEADEPSS